MVRISEEKRRRIIDRVVGHLEKMASVARDEDVSYRTVMKIVDHHRSSGGLADVHDMNEDDGRDGTVVFRPEVTNVIRDEEDEEIGWEADPDDDSLDCSGCGGTLSHQGWFISDDSNMDRLRPTFSFCPFCGRRVAYAEIRGVY